MRSNNIQSTNGVSLIRNLFAGGLVLACALSSTTLASAQSVTPPPTPTKITPPVGESAFLVGHAIGSQGYTCLPTATGGTSWTIYSARPEATLFSYSSGQRFQIS